MYNEWLWQDEPRDTNIEYSESSLREDTGKIVVHHGRARGKHTPARAHAQQLWVRKRLLEERDTDVSDLGSYHVSVAAKTTTIFLGR